MYSKRDNIETMINNEADEVKKELFNPLKNRYQNSLELMKGSLSLIFFIYCIAKVIK